MNRNIITRSDVPLVIRSPLPGKEGLEMPFPAPGQAGGLPPTPKPDDWYQRLLKYMPGEAIGFYLFLENLAKSQFSDDKLVGDAPAAAAARSQLSWFLGAALVIAILFNYLYLQRIWQVERFWQRVISCLALVVYVFGMGGVFALMPWYNPALGLAMLSIGAAFLLFVEPPKRPGETIPEGG